MVSEGKSVDARSQTVTTKDRRAVVDDPQLQDALKELLLASDGFRRAYEMWSHAPDPEVSWERTLLDEAQSRLDSARDRASSVGAPPRSAGKPR